MAKETIPGVSETEGPAKIPLAMTETHITITFQTQWFCNHQPKLHLSMISSIAWVPRGVADPSPKKYEMSAVEAELIQSMQTQARIGDNDDGVKDSDEDEELDDEEDERMKTMGLGHVILGGDTSNILEAEDGTAMQHDGDGKDTDQADENDDEQEQTANATSEMEDVPVKSENDDDNDSSEDEDDLEDIPDTREYTPLDVAALESMGLARAGMETDQPLMSDDDKSEMEDVRIGPDDALIAVAKTEDVR